MYTNFISKLPAGVQLIIYPYVMDESDRTKWSAQSKTGDVMDGIYSFATQWNTFLSSAGKPTFTGVVYDREEFGTYFTLTATNAAAMKAKYPAMKEIGVSCGFDETNTITKMASFVDFFYAEWYDLYNASGALDNVASSPFLTYKNNPSAMASYIMSQTVTSSIIKTYTAYAKKIYVMWSNQDLGTNCLYPLKGTACGANHEFGTWSPAALNQFLRLMAGNAPFNQVAGQGFFQFSFTNPSWM
jgi:hypothetical protein